MDNDRLKHSLAVARKMVEIAKINNLSETEIKDCFVIGYNHDIGYEKRLEDIKSRYGETSKVYENCYKLVSKFLNGG